MNHEPRNEREAAFSLGGTLTADPVRMGRHFLQSAPLRDRGPRTSALRAFVLLAASFVIPFAVTSCIV